jgi:predicted NAD/FAD-binding protein
MFEWLEVTTIASDMSFSLVNKHENVQWAGTNLQSVFAQKRNLLRVRFWQMLYDIVRFNRYAKQELAQADWSLSLGQFLKKYRYSQAFSQWYLLPMTAAIWSCPIQKTVQFPAAAHIHFFRNHGLLQITDRPQWMTVRGGAKQYVNKLLMGIHEHHKHSPVLKIVRNEQGVIITTPKGQQPYDAVVLACHADESLNILGDNATPAEKITLSQFKFQKNRAVLHTDEVVLPEHESLWSAWNFVSGDNHQSASVNYLINKLQPLPVKTPVIVSLNPTVEPRREKVIASFDYAHPVFDQRAHAAQQKLPLLQGKQQTWFCGAWTGYGFHEDGLRSGIEVAKQLGVTPPWELNNT